MEPLSPTASATGGQEGVTVRDSSADDAASGLQDGAHHLLTVTCDDRAGLLADLSEHLRAHGVDIVSAAVATDTESGHIVDSFAVRDAKTGSRLAPQFLESLCASLWQVAIGAAHPKRLSGGSAAAGVPPCLSPAGSVRRGNSGGSYAALSLTTVAEADSAQTPAAPRRSFDGLEEDADAVTLSNDANEKFTMLRVEVPDRPGLLTDLVQTLRVANVSVVAASIRTHGATAVDVFKITDSSTGGKLSSEKFEALRRGVAHRARRQAISQSLGHATSSLASASPAAPPPAADLAIIDAACVMLPPFKSLITSERQEIYAEMHQLRFSAGETLISEGTEVQQFIVLFEGEVAGSHRTLRRGDVLGELGIVQTTLSPDTWRAGAGGAVVYAVDRRTLHALLHGAAGRRRQRAANALQDLPMLEGLTKGQLYALVDVMRRAEVPPGAVLNDAFLHILLRGAVRLSDRGALHRGAAAEDEPAGPLTGPVLARAGDAYGEAACLSNGANPLGVCMSSVGDAEIMLCDRDTFARVLGPPEALLLPGAQRKVSLPRPPVARVPGASEAALARGVSAVALASDVIVEDADEEGGAARDASSGGDAAMAQAPPHREGSSAGVDAGVVAAALAAPLVGSSGNRFRTPNQDVTWHGSSAVRQALGAMTLPSGGAPAPKSALTSSLSMGSRQLAAVPVAGAVPMPFATPALPVAGGDRSSNRSSSAPSELSNIVSGAPAPGGGAGAPKGSWHMSLALGDFLLGAKLGEGLTGRVHYAKLKVRGAECALKVMRKSKLVELGEEHHVRSELDALGRIASPFITALLGCFQDVRAVYLAIEYMRGPDLFAYMHEINAPTGFERSVPIHAVRFYTAQVLLGLDALHSNGYVYRDLKPENILMDGHGNLKLADLGFAKLVFEGGRAYTVCGTPDYLAPEVIEHRGATRGSDYWALGILIFEFIAGFPPFQGEPKWYQFKKICTGHIEYWPERFVQEGRDLVCALLQTDESRRLGLLSGGVRDIKAHPFYAGLDWAALSSLALTPPFKPNEHEWGQATTSPSDSKRITAELRTTMEHDPPVSVAQQEIFKGW